MDREKYYKLIHDEEPDKIELTPEDIKSWLDDICDAYDAANKSLYSLWWGKLNEDQGEYEHQIQVCWDSFWQYGNQSRVSRVLSDIMIYKGIDKLAQIMGIKLEKKEGHSNVSYRYRYYFMYRGYEVFQLGKVPMESGGAE